MGFRVCLYKRSLLWRDSEEFLPVSQYILLYSARNCLLRSVIAERLALNVDTVCSPALDSVSCAGAVGKSDCC